MMTMTATGTPRVWVGCLACYNAAGYLVGEWFDAVDAPQEMDEFSPRVFCGKVAPGGHAENMHEELWVFDHEGFHGLLTGECSPSEARKLAEVLDSVDNPEAFAAYVGNVGLGVTASGEDNYGDAVASFEDAFCGEFDCGGDYAQDLADDLDLLPDPVFGRWPFTCIDWERAWGVLDVGGDNFAVATGRGTVYVFRSI